MEAIPIEILDMLRTHFEGKKVVEITQTWNGLTFIFEDKTELHLKKVDIKIRSYEVVEKEYSVGG